MIVFRSKNELVQWLLFCEWFEFPNMMFNTTNRNNVNQTVQPASLTRCFHCFAWALISIWNPWENFCFVALSPFYPFPSGSFNLSSDSFAHIVGMCLQYRWIFNLVIEYALLCIFSANSTSFITCVVHVQYIDVHFVFGSACACAWGCVES